jgi:hypothetical protein
VTFGITTDFDSTSDIDVFLHGIDRAISDLAQAAESAADTSVAVLASG